MKNPSCYIMLNACHMTSSVSQCGSPLVTCFPGHVPGCALSVLAVLILVLRDREWLAVCAFPLWSTSFFRHRLSGRPHHGDPIGHLSRRHGEGFTQRSFALIAMPSAGVLRSQRPPRGGPPPRPLSALARGRAVRRVPQQGAEAPVERPNMGQRRSQSGPQWGRDAHRAPQRGVEAFTECHNVG